MRLISRSFERGEPSGDEAEDVNGAAAGVNLEDELARIETQCLEGLVMIGLEPSMDHLFAHVIEPVLAQGTGLEPFHHLVRIEDLEVEDLDHVDEPGQPLGLRVAPRHAVEHQGVLLGHDQFLHLQDIEVPLEDPHGEVVGDQQPREVYCSISRPNRPLRGILRKTSPIEMWMKLGSWPSTAPCVPLPLPGIPNRRMERYL